MLAVQQRDPARPTALPPPGPFPPAADVVSAMQLHLLQVATSK